MWGGQVSPIRRGRFRAAKRTEIAASIGQTILFSGRGVVRRICASTGDKLLTMSGAVANVSAVNILLAISGVAAKINNGDTIVTKTHAKIGTITHLSIIGVERLARLARANSKECIGALDILWHPPIGMRAPRARQDTNSSDSRGGSSATGISARSPGIGRARPNNSRLLQPMQC